MGRLIEHMNSWSQNWFDSWKDLTSTQPWQTALEDWWRQAAGNSPADAPAALGKIASQSRAFFELAEQFGKLAPSADGGDQWQKNLDQMFDSLKQAFGAYGEEPGLPSFWQMPLADWQKTMAVLSPAGFDASAGLQQLLSFPGLGQTREAQEDRQKLGRLLLAYQKACQNFSSVFAKMNNQSLDLMRDRLLARMGAGEEPVTRVQELYNLWVDCSEEVYANEALSDEYTSRHGDMVNALMALKQQSARLTDEFAERLNMPTRAEMDTLHERYQATRRQEKTLRQEVASLTDQVQHLLGRIEELEAAASRGGRAVSTSKKKSIKKSTKRAGRKSGKSAGKTDTGSRHGETGS